MNKVIRNTTSSIRLLHEISKYNCKVLLYDVFIRLFL